MSNCGGFSSPVGGAGWIVTGEGFTTGRTVVWRGWMMMVLVWSGAAAWAMGTVVMSGLGWMETLGLTWMGLFSGWRGFAVRTILLLVNFIIKSSK